MVTYKKTKAVYVKSRRNGFDASKFFIIVEVHGGTQYQIKFNEVGQRHNVNEFIAHYIGISMGAPMLNGAFLYLEEGELLRVKKAIESQGNSLRDVDIWDMTDGMFFGIEWEQNPTKITNEDELLDRLSETSNAREFFSLYSIDQYLKNYDRHIGNHIVVQRGNSTKYHLIDHDRLFGSTNWSLIPTYINNLDPLIIDPSMGSDYHGFLLWIVNDKSVHDIHYYAGRIASIPDEDIKDMCDTILQVYRLPNSEIDLVKQWSIYRKEHIVMKCFEHEAMLPNVRKKGIYSAS